MLHTYDPSVAFGPLFDIHVAKDPEKGDPAAEEDGVPYEGEGHARSERDEVEEGGKGGEGSYYFGIDLQVLR